MDPAGAPDDGPQRSYFAAVDAAHFRWQTESPHIAGSEAALLAGVELAAGARLLEVGCGQGANLVHLRRRLGAAAHLFGVDASAARAGFAAAASGARCARGDAARLPYGAAAFDAVLLRDLLHHVTDRRAVLREAARVLRPGGSLTVIEPNGRNPLIAAAALVEPVERGMLASTSARAMADAAAAGFVELRLEWRQPFPLSRLVLHYRVGRPRLADRPALARALTRIETLAERLPRALWAYFIVAGRRCAPVEERRA